MCLGFAELLEGNYYDLAVTAVHAVHHYMISAKMGCEKSLRAIKSVHGRECNKGTGMPRR